MSWVWKALLFLIACGCPLRTKGEQILSRPSSSISITAKIDHDQRHGMPISKEIPIPYANPQRIAVHIPADRPSVREAEMVGGGDVLAGENPEGITEVEEEEDGLDPQSGASLVEAHYEIHNWTQINHRLSLQQTIMLIAGCLLLVLIILGIITLLTILVKTLANKEESKSIVFMPPMPPELGKGDVHWQHNAVYEMPHAFGQGAPKATFSDKSLHPASA